MAPSPPDSRNSRCAVGCSSWGLPAAWPPITSDAGGVSITFVLSAFAAAVDPHCCIHQGRSMNESLWAIALDHVVHCGFWNHGLASVRTCRRSRRRAHELCGPARGACWRVSLWAVRLLSFVRCPMASLRPALKQTRTSVVLGQATPIL